MDVSAVILTFCGAASDEDGVVGSVTLTAAESAVVVLLYASTLKEYVAPAVKPVTVAEVAVEDSVATTVVCVPLTCKMR